MRYRSIVVLRLVLAAAASTFTVGVAPASAQGEAAVRGQVLAAADGSALPGVVVSLTSVAGGEVMQTTTDTSGRFSFPHVTPGEHSLAGAPEGFRPYEVRFVLKPREIRTVTISLALSEVQVNVEITGDAVRMASTHSPSSTTVTAQRLDNMPAPQRTNLPDAIVSLAPGMIRGHDDFVHIRGHEVALNPLIGGVSFWENPHALFSAGMSPTVIETANVMTGSFSAEYGNRFGGVVDIATKSGFSMRDTGSFALNGGEAGRRSAEAEYGGHRQRLSYYLFGSMFESDRFLSPPDPQAIHDSGRGAHAFVRLDGDLGRAGSLRGVFMGDGTNFEIPKTPLDVELRPSASPDQRTRQQTAVVGWTRAASDLSIGASFYQRWSRARLMPGAGPLTAVARLNRELLTLGAKADVTRFAGPHVIKAGVDAVRLAPQEELSYDYAGYSALTHLLGWPHIHFGGEAIQFAARESGGQISAYVQDAIQLGPRVTADVGLRVDRYALLVSAFHASPRVNLAFQVGGGAVLHASYNHFFVAPPIEGVLSSSAGLTAQISEIGTALPALEPTTEHQVEVGGSTPLGPLQVALTGYYRETDNPVHTTVWSDSRIYSYASFDREQAYGLEMKAEAPMLARYGVTGYLNYALGRVNFYNPVTGGFVTEAGHFSETSRFLAPMDQTHTLTAGLTYRHARTGVWLGTAMEYGSGTPVGHGGSDHEHAEGDTDHDHAATTAGTLRVPDHFTASFSLGADVLRDGRQRSRLSLQLDIENLTNNVYLVAQEGEFSPAQFSIPRLLSVSAKIRF